MNNEDLLILQLIKQLIYAEQTSTNDLHEQLSNSNNHFANNKIETTVMDLQKRVKELEKHVKQLEEQLESQAQMLKMTVEYVSKK